MKTQKKTFVIILVLLFSIIPLGILSFAIFSSGERTLPDYQPLHMDADSWNRNLPVSGEKLVNIKTAESLHTSPAPGEYYDVGDVMEWLSLDDWYGYYYWTDFELRAINDLAEIWVQTDLTYGWDIFGGTFEDPRSDPIVTDDQIDYLLDEFTNNIYPSTTEYFGLPDSHNGDYGVWPEDYAGSAREVIMVHNFKDEAYYYPDYPYYIAGFYSPTFEFYFDRNIINIDSHDWENRVGPDGARPNLYEGTIAHEYQHLIHDDYFVSSATFMNEGCSMFSEVLCGYPTDWSSINSFLSTPDNSLTEWGDQTGINILADYGQVYLWASYLVSNYGSDILKNYIATGIPGIAGLELLFSAFFTDFDAVVREWTLANLMRTGYDNIDFDDKAAGDLRVYEVKDKWPLDISGTDFGTTTTILDYDTGISRVGSYGTDYVLLSKLKWQYPSILYFEGDSHAWTPHWHKDGSAWYSSSSDPLSALDLFLNVDLSGSSVLSFDTLLDIEPFWDFGFVQISADGGMTWTSLENDYTTSDHAGTTDEIQLNLPGLTGRSGGWMSMSFDLPEFTGDAIIRFHYMTDWGTQLDGWWVDNVAIDGTSVSEEDFWIVYDPPETSFLVTVLRQDFWDGEYYYNLIAEFDVPGGSWFTLDLADFLSSPGKNLRYPDVVLAITPRVGVADYSFSVVPI